MRAFETADQAAGSAVDGERLSWLWRYIFVQIPGEQLAEPDAIRVVWQATPSPRSASSAKARCPHPGNRPVRSSGLGTGTMPPDLLTDLLSATGISEVTVERTPYRCVLRKLSILATAGSTYSGLS
jgi:hypothetical protein